MTERSQTDMWVAAARRGDRLALAKLLAYVHPRLLARAEAGLGTAVKARMAPDDVLQEVYLSVARQIAEFEDRGPGSFLGWVCAILDHKLIDVQRAAHRQARDIDREVRIEAAATDSYWNLLDVVYAESTTPSRALRRQEAVSAIATCLEDLSEPQREVIRLRYLEGLSVAEIAARLDRTEGAVVALCQRALKALRVAMDRRGEFTRGN